MLKEAFRFMIERFPGRDVHDLALGCYPDPMCCLVPQPKPVPQRAPLQHN